jgi:hypothetical protein
MYFRPKEGRDKECDVPIWIKESWEWIHNRANGIPCTNQGWFKVPVMRRVAITTPNVMAALRRLNRDQARPYNFALSPVIVNLSGSPITRLFTPGKQIGQNGPLRLSRSALSAIEEGMV